MGKPKTGKNVKTKLTITNPLHDGAPLVSLIHSTLKFQRRLRKEEHNKYTITKVQK